MHAVLMLHCVDSSRSVLSISASELASLIGAIRSSGHSIVALRDLLQGRAPPRALALTFDDGALSVAEAGAPILADLGVPATLFLTTGYVGRDNAWPSQPRHVARFPMMAWHHVERLHAQGWAIEAHSVTHPDLRQLDAVSLDEEFARPVEEIERRLGIAPTIVAFPYGYHNPLVVAHAQRHYQHAVTTSFRPLGKKIVPHAVPRLDTFYLRQPQVHRWFGDGVPFRAYLAGRRLLRQLRGHPGE